MTDLTNQYTPRMMDTAMRQVIRPTSFLLDMIGANSRIRRTDKKYIEMDKEFGDSVVARMVARNGAANVLGHRGFSNNIDLAPYYKERVPYTPSDVDTRTAGSTVYDDNSNQVDQQMALDLNTLYTRLDRAEELQAATGLQTGTLPVSGRDVDYTVDFGMNANHLITLTGTDRWTESTSAKLDQISAWSALIDDKGAPGAAWMIGEMSAMNNLLSDTAILALLDNRRVQRGEINFKLLREQRATYLGALTGHGFDIDLYSYQGHYTSVHPTTGTATDAKYMNTSTVILGSGQADVRKYYTKIENFKATGFSGDRFPHYWEEDDGSAKYLQVESGPMVAIAQPDAFVTVITTSAS